MKILTALAVAALFLAGCAKKNDTTEAIRQGVMRDLAPKFDMSKMDITVNSVSFRDKEADATVSFALKGDAKPAMTMNYVLERRDDNLWYIKTRTSAAMSGGADGATGGGAALPPGHPATDGSTPEGGASLPPGHPATGQKQ